MKLSDTLAAALWQRLDVSPDTELHVAAMIPAADLEPALADFRARHDLTPGDSGRLALLFARIYETAAPVTYAAPSATYSGIYGTAAPATYGAPVTYTYA